MATITKKQRATLMSALAAATRARCYLSRSDIAVGVLDRPSTTTLHYTRADGSTFYSLDKDIGSDLAGLETCIRTLNHFLSTEVPS